MACRDANRGQKAREAIVRATGSQMVGLIGLDLSSMKHVAKFVQNLGDKYQQVG